MGYGKEKMPTSDKVMWAIIVFLFSVMAAGWILKATSYWKGF